MADNSPNTEIEPQTTSQFVASLTTALAVFGIQFVAFLLIKDRFARIYSPRTYLVPERERIKPVSPGWFNWIKPVLSTSNSEFVHKCGLDAYFFLRYLRMLLKIFVPAAAVILPILLPLNAANGKGPNWSREGPNNATDVTGLDQLAWGNIKPANSHRYWAHFLLAFFLVCHVCYVSFDELRNYIRMRQAYVTSPQHRLRASATTVLVNAIPEKWLSVEALEGLYDVFPGGIRNIWINRNLDELSDKVARRDKLAKRLESAETNLIRKCFKTHQKAIVKAEKEAGKSKSKEEKKRQSAALDEMGREKVQAGGMESNNPHQVQHNIREALGEGSSEHSDAGDDAQPTNPEGNSRQGNNIPLIGDGLHVIGSGLNNLGKGIIGGIRGVNKGVNDRLNTTNGFMTDEAAPESSQHQGETRTGVEATGYLQERTRSGDWYANEASPRSFGGFDGGSDQTRIAAQAEHDQIPLTKWESSTRKDAEQDTTRSEGTKSATAFEKLKNAVGAGGQDATEPVEYPSAFNDKFAGDAENAMWKKFVTEKDRDTMRLPIFGWQWMPSLPLMGEKVDTIYYCREEVARLNLEIEDDQAHPERYPLMNSAFIQFNHQVAAHMACQSVSHHLPKQMDPRIVEIDPSDVIWDNMSIPWWQSYVRTGGVIATVTGMIILWAIPVAFTSALAQLSSAAGQFEFLRWVLDLPPRLIDVLQGVLSPVLLALLMFLLPVILRFLSRLQGMQSGVLVELSVQKYYFFFLFVQIFLVVTIASAAFNVAGYFDTFARIDNIPMLLGQNIPKASNYFISYMILQALSVSAGALVQIGGLVSWFILAPILDSTARAKFRRQTQLSNIQWGTFFPVYTNLACIGLIYSVVSPLILVFNIITFSLFWFVYRYQTLYVTRFTLDTGGLLFPNAINTTFVGVYVMELALIVLFFLVRDEQDGVAAKGEAIGMIVIMIMTAGYQLLLNSAFRPLFRYLPITLEDDAVRRDEEFARAMRIKHGDVDNDDADGGSEDIEDRLEQQERTSLEEDQQAHEYEMREIERDRKRRSQPVQNPVVKSDNIELQNPEILQNIDRENKGLAFMRKTANKTADVTLHKLPGALNLPHADHRRSSWADRSHNRRSSAYNAGDGRNPHRQSYAEDQPRHRKRSPPRQVLEKINAFNPIAGNEADLEAQQKARNELADALFSGVNDELEDLTPEERDTLVQRAFQHAALRARRPVIWIPRDELGVSDDELVRMGNFSQHIWVSNMRQGLDAKGRTMYSGAPPDFSELDLIRL